MSCDRSSLRRVVREAATGEPAGLPGRLCDALAGALEVDGAAISALTHTSSRWPLGSTDKVADLLETVQFTTGQGPCVEASATGRPVIVEDLHADSGARWPAFAELARERLGEIGAVFGFALCLEDTTFGSINLYSRAPRTLHPDEVAAGTEAAALATAALLSTPRAVPEGTRALLITGDPWQSMHIAIGITAAVLGILPEDALAHLRAYSFSHDMLLPDLAAEILDDRIDPAQFTQ